MTLHEFLAPEVKHAAFEDPDADPAPEITQKGLAKSCPVCVETLDLWTSIYGAEAGNLALKVLATIVVVIAASVIAADCRCAASARAPTRVPARVRASRRSS